MRTLLGRILFCYPVEEDRRARLESGYLFHLRVRTSCPTNLEVRVDEVHVPDVLVRDAKRFTEVPEKDGREWNSQGNPPETKTYSMFWLEIM